MPTHRTADIYRRHHRHDHTHFDRCSRATRLLHRPLPALRRSARRPGAAAAPHLGDQLQPRHRRDVGRTARPRLGEPDRRSRTQQGRSRRAGSRPRPPRPAPSKGAAPRRGQLTETVDGFLEWLYLLHPALRIVEVYEATCHTRWLRHSLHHLNPEEELFVIEPDPRGGTVPDMTVCTACGAVDEVEYHELPSMVGYGVDTCTSCRRCGSSVATDPMFGAHVDRRV